jgi:hypothetical protein
MTPTPAAAQPQGFVLWHRPNRRAKWRRVATGTRQELLRLMDRPDRSRSSDWIITEGGRKP